MSRTAVFIDGGPFTDSIRGQGLPIHVRLRGLIDDLVKGHNVVSIDFVVPEYPADPYPAKSRNERERLERFEKEGVLVHRTKPQIIGSVFVDRGVESVVTAKMILAAKADQFDTAILVSRRAELSTAIAAVRECGKSVGVAFFEFANGADNPLREQADFFQLIDADHVRRSLW